MAVWFLNLQSQEPWDVPVQAARESIERWFRGVNKRKRREICIVIYEHDFATFSKNAREPIEILK